MKKILLILVAVVFGLLGCVEERIISFINNSDQTVNFNLTTGNRTADYLVEPYKQYDYSLLVTFDHKLNSYQSSPIADNVDLVQDNDIYIFNNKPLPLEPVIPDPMPVHILNTLSKDVVLKSNNLISTDPLTISANTEIKTETIINYNVSLTAETIDGYPVSVNTSMNEEIYFIVLR
jgi:hypothetical protein